MQSLKRFYEREIEDIFAASQIKRNKCAELPNRRSINNLFGIEKPTADFGCVFPKRAEVME